MEVFIDDVDYFIAYASAIEKLPNLPESTREFVKKIIFDAEDIRNAYQQSLGENIEELEEGAEDICAEMEIFEEMMRTNESALDGCLTYTDTHPTIQLQFGINVLFISECAEC
ncbi:MAG: hypothetical protein HGA36_03480 [Candidatus Moranbacteria bacterium]|nr:hypothetical protein [Candidatus Moranbacteria bacterium]